MVFAALSVWATVGARSQRAIPRLVVIFVVDGLRPDAITQADTPTLARLRAEGAEYRNSHSVFPTVTRLNTATLATGTFPIRHGIVGNSMYVASVNRDAPFDTGDYHTLLRLEETTGRAITADTLGEKLQRHGRRLVTVSSGSTGNGFLLNPEARHGAGIAINGLFERGTIAAFPQPVSDAILARFGAPPADPDDLGQMQWTDTVLREYVLPELAPQVVIDWLGPLDSSQHAEGVGSPAARTALREIDKSIARTIAVLDERGWLSSTDILITSDHGFAHHATGVDVVGAMVAAGLKRSRTSVDDVVVASQSQSLLVYVPGHEAARVAALSRFFQQAPWADVVFTRQGSASAPGTFPFSDVQGAHPTRAPDLIVSLAWDSSQNVYGAVGSQTINSTTGGPLGGNAAGHGGLAPWVVHNALIAWGGDFKRHAVIDAPASLADITPTVLTVLDLAGEIPTGSGAGRVLEEVLVNGRDATSTRRTVRTEHERYRAALEVSVANGHDYIDSGARVR